MNWILMSLLSLLSQATEDRHPIHLSVMEIYTEEKSQNLAFSITFFMDDFGPAAGYSQNLEKINSGKMTVDDLILNYLEKHLSLKVNERTVQYKIKEKESNFPSVTCYMELKKSVKKVEQIEIQNTILFEQFDDQKNMVHLRIPGQKEGSMILNRKKKSGVAKW